MIPNTRAYLDDDTWAKVMKLVAPRTIKIMVSDIACVFSYFIIYISNYP